MEDFILPITWGDRVSICNLFQTVGSLEEMQISRMMRTILIEGEPASELQKNGIQRFSTGTYYIAEKNENRESSVTLNEVELRAFASFIKDLSDKRQVHIVHEDVFSAVMEKFNAITKGEEA